MQRSMARCVLAAYRVSSRVNICYDSIGSTKRRVVHSLQGLPRDFHRRAASGSAAVPIMDAATLRAACRDGSWTSQTSGQAYGKVQANLVALPAPHAYDFLLFCQRNPKPCPLLDVTEIGEAGTALADDANVYTDLPMYNVFRDGVFVETLPDVSHLREPGMVAFLLGCSFSFEAALLDAGVPVRHLEGGVGRDGPAEATVPMYRTNLSCRPAGVFSGPIVVSMRPMKPDQAIRATQVTSRFPGVHGAPLHVGDPALIGVGDLNRPDWGDPVDVYEDEVPVFWACGVTPQAAVMAAAPSLAITHYPGCMFVADVDNATLASFP